MTIHLYAVVNAGALLEICGAHRSLGGQRARPSLTTGMESRLAATAAVGPFMDSLRMRSREGGVNVPNRRSGRAGERGQCAARGSREAYHRVAVIIGGGQQAGQLTSGHASMAQAKLCSCAHHSGDSRGSPCHRCTSTCLVPAKLKGASQVRQQRVLEVATCGELQAAPTSGAPSRSPRRRSALRPSTSLL